MAHIHARRTRRHRSSTADLATRLRGRAGPKGEQGVPGPAGALSADHLEYFEHVTEEIAHIHRDLDIQLRRFAQVQMQMDQLRALLAPNIAPVGGTTAGPRKPLKLN
ncbi:MAG TPA: hypothetical protein VGZ27_07135 [Vicinamibacterales bacterium]|jgi:hypothetical protein|nr:hypothetical protein [Vicinamibacterales bacterium]